jgi:hypothetical protein
VLSDLLNAFQPGPIQSGLPANPFGATGVSWLVALQPLAAALFLLGFLGSAVLALSAVTARFRRSRGLEREQMKWFLASFVAVAFFAPFSTFDGSPEATVFDLALIVSIGFIPISVGIAVTRYRLYDIDTIINRALVYGLLTSILAGASAAAIAVLQRAFSGVVGGSEFTIVLTTLVVVAAFNPLKLRLQALVDRRFKEARDATSLLVAYADELETSPWAVDPARALQRLAHLAARGTGAAVTRATLAGPGVSMVATSGPWVGEWSTFARAERALVALTLEVPHGATSRAGRDGSLAEDALGRILGALLSDRPGEPAVAADAADVQPTLGESPTALSPVAATPD